MAYMKMMKSPKVAPGKPDKIEKTLHEWKEGSLHSGSKEGPLVKSKSQAIAIALNQQRKANRS